MPALIGVDARNGSPAMLVRALVEADRPWAAALVAEHFGSPVVLSRRVLHDTRSLPGLIAQKRCQRLGLLQHRRTADQMEIVVLIACRPREGIGRRLLEAAKDVARAQGCRRLWLITTNDNRPALAFYQAVGWRQCAIHRGAITAARRLKPQIPPTGHAGIPIETRSSSNARSTAGLMPGSVLLSVGQPIQIDRRKARRLYSKSGDCIRINSVTPWLRRQRTTFSSATAAPMRPRSKRSGRA